MKPLDELIGRYAPSTLAGIVAGAGIYTAISCVERLCYNETLLDILLMQYNNLEMLLLAGTKTVVAVGLGMTVFAETSDYLKALKKMEKRKFHDAVQEDVKKIKIYTITS